MDDSSWYNSAVFLKKLQSNVFEIYKTNEWNLKKYVIVLVLFTFYLSLLKYGQHWHSTPISLKEWVSLSQWQIEKC